MCELWKPVNLYIKYFTIKRKIKLPYKVSNWGRVMNKYGKILKPFLRGKKKGTYPCVDLCLGGTRHRIDVHRLVALHFISNPDSKPEVNHLDCNPMNYRADNLEWCTRQENEAHKNFMNCMSEFSLY